MLTRRERLRQETSQAIKDTARRLMAAHGTAGLSLRAIAREMGMSAAALYHYFPSLDDLITLLIAENFNALADALERARDTSRARAGVERLEDVLMAYRAWAVEHPVDFQLIYGNPIPGYVAPREVTVPAAVRGFSVIVGLIQQLIETGEIRPQPPYDRVPPEVEAHMRALIARDGYPASPQALYLGVVGWTALHGILMLELFNHLQPVIGDVETYYRDQVRRLLITIGLNDTS